MTESHVEQLLSQMKLKEPSWELDDRICGAITSDGMKTRRVSQIRPSAFLAASVLGVACLLAGVAIGRASTSQSVNELLTDTGSDRMNDAVDQKRPVQLESGVGMDREQPTLTSLHGPPLAIMCSVATQTDPEETDQRCRKCHAGNNDVDSKFGEGVAFVLNIHRGLCARCHKDTEQWNPQQINDTFFGPPAQDVPGHG
ncbi:MAG: hypothetical protein R3C59_08520 [Planctomycetaceae bacterium]